MDESGQWYGNQLCGDRFMETDMEGILGHRGVMCSVWGFEVPVGVSARVSLYFVYRWNVV